MQPPSSYRFPIIELYSVAQSINQDNNPCAFHPLPQPLCDRAKIKNLSCEILRLTPELLSHNFVSMAKKLYNLFHSMTCSPSLATHVGPVLRHLFLRPQNLNISDCRAINLQVDNAHCECREKITQAFKDIWGVFILRSGEGLHYTMEHAGDSVVSIDCRLVAQAGLTQPAISSLECSVLRYHFFLEELAVALPKESSLSLGALPVAAAATVGQFAFGVSLPFAASVSGLGVALTYMLANKIGIYKSDPVHVTFRSLSTDVPELEFGFDPKSSGVVGRTKGVMQKFFGYQETGSLTCGFLRLRLPDEPVPYFDIDLSSLQPIHPNDLWSFRELLLDLSERKKISLQKLYLIIETLKKPITDSAYPEKPIIDRLKTISLESLYPVCINMALKRDEGLREQIASACRNDHSNKKHFYLCDFMR